MEINRSSLGQVLAALVLWAVVALPTVAAEPIPQQRLEAAAGLLEAEVEAGKLAGGVVLVAQGGEVRLSRAVGMQSIEDDIPMSRDTIFRIFSMTKPVVGTALMVLHDEGKFSLDDPVEKHIPEFAGLTVATGRDESGKILTEPVAEPMTVRQLMNHSAGLTYGFFSDTPVDRLYKERDVLDRDSTLKAMIDKLAGIPLWAQPGTRWHYSIAVDVQGYLVEILSGMPLDEFLEKRIFTPLGMVDTGFHVPPEKAQRLARYYAPVEGAGLQSRPNSDYLKEPGLLSGGGGLVSTAADYLRFAQMHLNGGELDGVRILSPEAVELMRSDQLPEGVVVEGQLVDPGNVFGLDFAIVADSAAALGQPPGNYYWWGIAGTWFWIDPTNELIYIGLIQTTDVVQSVTLHRRTKHTVYGD